MVFKKIDPKQSFPQMEEEILKFWDEQKIFEKSVAKNPEDKPFVFYEGPPTANGKPGLHHVLARAFKDIIPRYKTMKGYRVERKAGWDTHGLPVELQVEKALGLKNKQEIENIVSGDPRASVIEFNKKCKESVWEYKDLWEKLTRRMAYWVDMEKPYITYENKYIESVWWVIAQIFKTKNAKGESLVYKGHKVVPYCYRCGTALSSHEVAQGYQTVKDNSVYIKFKAKPNPEKGIDDNTYFLAWTTTPWTLPGNVALAVNKKVEYIKYKFLEGDNAGETFIVALSSLAKILSKNTELVDVNDEHVRAQMDKILGNDLLGFKYEPLYAVENKESKKAHYIVAGDFVSTADGTGIVHIAPAFGEDDANVGKENNLPTLLTVDEMGKINADVPGKGIPVKKKNEKNKYAVDELILEDLKERKLLFGEELYEHEYPFCWRCDTPLIYYAKPSWFIRMSELSEDLVKNNVNINWIPEYIKEGRFGEWLRGAKDWAISRERYWGTPLPIWECAKCGETKVVGSIEEIKEQIGNPNKLFLVRHGEGENNIVKVYNTYPETIKFHLTEKGIKQAEEVGESLRSEKIDFIFSSPFTRTLETAEIISKKLGVEVIADERLKEAGAGEFNEKPASEFLKIYPTLESYAEQADHGVETVKEIRERMQSFLNEINDKYQNKNILIVSHRDPLKILNGLLEGKTLRESFKGWTPMVGDYGIFYSKPFDLHKPFIDDVKLKCVCGEEMKRAPEVLDVWFDSGSMPLAQFFYPNAATTEDKERIESGKFFPADYISEAIDQTRGWFYTLHAIATLLQKAGKVPAGYAFKNVICLAHILDAQGKKMSKSRGNIVDPMEVMDQYGADMLRWMLFTINQPGQPKKFDLKAMRDIMNRVFRMLWNSYSFFTMYAIIDKWESKNEWKSENLLDKWIISELNVLIKNTDGLLEKYDIYAAAGGIEKFIDNLSNWYIRRSRKRFWKSEDDGDKKEAYATLHYVLVKLSKLMAPFTPFIAEEIYKNLTGEESVHLSNFPEADEKLIDEKLNEEMQKTREIITEALQLRAKAGIKVRQPLRELRIVNAELRSEFVDIIKEELNVKEVGFGSEKIELDIEITPELKLEGQAREVVRVIQEMRKEAGFEVENRIKVAYSGAEEIFEKFGDLIAKEVLADEMKAGSLTESDLEKEFQIDGVAVKIAVKR